MIIMKFGGTSVGNAQRIKEVARIIRSQLAKKPVVVVSAVSKVTDALITLAHACAQGKGQDEYESIKKIHSEIIIQLSLDPAIISDDLRQLHNLVARTRKSRKLDTKVLDHFQSFGECMSSKIVSAYLNRINIPSKALNAGDAGLLTDETFGGAEPLETSYATIKRAISAMHGILVITGFIGKTKKGEITTLGRGGSDYSAAVIGAAIDAKEIQIWTDVDGIMSTDPKIVNDARTIKSVSFAEAAELAYFGAEVLHPKTIFPAMRKKIPVKVLNTMNRSGSGTTILAQNSQAPLPQGKKHLPSSPIKAIACKKNIILINIESTRMLGVYGFLSRMFRVFEKYKKSVDVIATSEISVSLTIDSEENLDEIVRELAAVSTVKVSKHKAILCIIGENMRYTLGVAGRMFTVLSDNAINVEMISQGASEINITFIIDQKEAEKAMRLLHAEFFR